ncbi:MAG: hypothetical protein HFI53_03545 [Lachnospiraceae bacterium]|nr:hypothetical protein [Lachnospiraceae bacterium]
MVQGILLKGWHLNGKSVMKKAVMAMIMGAALLTVSSCGQAKNSQDAQTNVISSTAESGGSTGEVQKTQNDNIIGSDLAELENLTGEYEYLSDYGTGKLMIQKSSNGYDISDYESESSCRFLADSSNIETIENNRIYVKYPEQVFSDDTVNFSYYILEYSTDEINVYCGEAGFEEAQFLYHATKKTEVGSDVYEYEGEYNSYDVNEPALEIKKNDDATYQIQIDLFRLRGFYDGAGKITEEGLEFTATGPRGKEMNGVIKLEEDIAVVTIFGQEWLDFAGLSEYKFYKTSDVPNIDDFPANQQESNMQDAATGSEAAVDELLDSFINGLADAVDSEDSASTFSVNDLNLDSQEWDAYSIGEKVDLDNDGENELIINGPYGGIYLDACDDKLYEFAAGEGTALVLSYTYYNGAVWIMYSNRSSAGFEFYHMEKFEGADHLTAEMNFGEEFDPNNAEAGIKYTLDGAEISYDEYTELCSKIFAAEVNTN